MSQNRTATQPPADDQPGTPSSLLDVLLVGCGLRGTGFLTANPELLQYRIGVVDGSPVLGPGSFDRYRIDSNSYGHDFFGWVDPGGVYGQPLEHPHVKALTQVQGSFALSMLAAALRPFGAAIQRAVGPSRVWLGETVASIEVRAGVVVAVLADGRRIHARFAVLALGIRERLCADLLPWQGKTLLSGQVIEHGAPASWLKRPLRIVIAGASHSAYAIANRLRQKGRLAPGSEVRVLQRGGTRLFYSSTDEYQKSAHSPLEHAANMQTDVCPQTGNVFRYSGLRHAARDTFQRMAAGTQPGFIQTRVGSLKQAGRWLDKADVVIQALGYESRCVPLTVNGVQASMLSNGPIVNTTAEGRLRLIDGQAVPVFVMGMNPYPYDDNSVTPTGQYAARGQHILDALSQYDPSAADRVENEHLHASAASPT